jgi:hypothetical protein
MRLLEYTFGDFILFLAELMEFGEYYFARGPQANCINNPLKKYTAKVCKKWLLLLH